MSKKRRAISKANNSNNTGDSAKTGLIDPKMAQVLNLSDLTRAIVATILALILQITLAFYLSRGGWQLVKSVFHL